MANQTTKTQRPSIPVVTGIQPAALQHFINVVREILNVSDGGIGDPLDREVTFRDLLNSGLVICNYDGQDIVSESGAVEIGKQFSVQVVAPSKIDYTVPPSPTGLGTTNSALAVFLLWDAPIYSNHAYTEVWRATYPDGLVNATLSAVIQGNTRGYGDIIGAAGDFNYWIRFVSKADIPSAYNAVSGIRGIASGAIVNSFNTRVGAITLSSTDVSAVLDADLNAIAALTGTAGWIHTDGAGNWAVSNPVSGASGSFTTVDLKTVTVVNGLITAIV